jgi:hypothetical protein
MADTYRADLGVKCEDCKTDDAIFKHWGPLAPPGKIIQCCAGCMKKRGIYLAEHGHALEKF